MGTRVLPTEPVGSIPRPERYQRALASIRNQALVDQEAEAAVRETVAKFEATGSPIITDGEQTKSSFLHYVFEGADNIGPGSIAVGFTDGHKRDIPQLLAGPFRYGTYADKYVRQAKALTERPVKVAVMSVHALSLIYPANGIDGYSKDQFLDDLVAEAAKEIVLCFEAGADSVQIDWTEGRLSLKLDPSGAFLDEGIRLNNAVIAAVPEKYHDRIGLHTCPGGDRDSTHSADVPYEALLARMFEINATRFYLQMITEPDYEAALKVVAKYLREGQIAYVGVTNHLVEEVESAETVRDRILLAAKYIPIEQLGTTDDCGFSPFTDDLSTSRDTAFAKIKARIDGNALASAALLG
jgi:5-methyltetrahydropteroyltriglutamate--homocysteine methyltransferase